ncbi:MAG TPA: glutamate--tRNA ligase [Stellaceae bacterium]|jgi:glutamyl-tRNA synthetase|nr:glutamate--tRNA ligase [Stellaceae bacterium]
MTVTVRFAPSPTGFLHIGGARTALFNWLFARHHGGVFRLRIEDTDRARSTPEATAAILDGLGWLGLDWDGETVHQFAGAARHAEIAREMLAAGRAYHCYMSPAELEAMREQARAEKRSVRIDSPWRDRDPADAPPGVAPVIRLKAPQDGATVIRDLVQGEVTVANSELDDLILLRADGTPTYNLSVVVDDHDMGITHVIRGDDHLRNAFRQTHIYRAAGWDVPAFAHIPLIHDAAGLKMSKRRGTVAVDAYRDLGYLPEGLRNYLLRLGWSHGDDEVIALDDAVKWFSLDAVGRAPSRFDQAKLDNVNAHYLKEAEDARLVALLTPFLSRPPTPGDRLRLLRGMPGLKPRAKTIAELAEKAAFYVAPRPLAPAPDAAKLLIAEARTLLAGLAASLAAADWSHETLEAALRDFATAKGLKLGAVAQPLRAALTGSTASPGIFEVMEVLGRDECLGRLADAAQGADQGQAIGSA